MVFDEINTSELSYPGIGENVVSDEEEDTFTFTTRSFLPFVTYPEVLPVSYSTGSEDKVFNPGIFDNDAFKDKSSKELAPSKALLTLDVFDPLHPPLMDFNVTKAFFGFKSLILKIFSKKFYEPGIKNALERIEKTKRSKKRSKTNKKREKDKESRARQRIQPEITAGSARHSQTQSKKEIKEVKDPKGNLKDQIHCSRVLVSSVYCAVCGTPVDGPYCHGCTLIRTKFEKDLFTYCVDNGVFQNFQDTPESSNDNTNVVNAPREPSVVDSDTTPPVASMEMLHAQADLIESMQSFLMKYDHIPHNEKSIKLLLAEEKFLKIKQVVEEEQTQPEYLQELLQSLLNDLQILNEIQPLKQEIPNQIQKDQRKKIEDMSIEEMIHEQQLVDREIKEIINDLGYKRFRGEEIDEEYERDCEIRIQKLKQDFNIWGSEVRKKEKAYEDEKYAAACRYMLSVTCDDDDDDNLGFYAVHPNTIHIPVSQNVEPKDSLIMGDGHINTTPETEAISVETLVSNPSESDDFSLGESCVDDDDTDDDDDDDDYDDDFYDCVDIEEDGGEIDLDISKIVDISLREKLVESYLLIEKINAFSLSPPIPISPIFCPSSTIPVVDIDLPLEEADLLSFSDNSITRGIESDRDSGEDTTSIDALPLDDSIILSEYESFTFDDEPGMVEVNVFDEINTSELSYPGIGENVVLDEEEDSFTFTTRTFLPFVTYPEVLPASYSTGSEDKIFKPGIFDNVLKRKSFFNS
ncbi:hypothetical protein Tco_0084187 [Tanacetum coccineum]